MKQAIHCAMHKKTIAIFCLLQLTLFTAGAQAYTIEQSKDTLYTQQGDTIFTNKGFSIFRRQRLIIGKGSRENGWYQSIGFKNTVNFPEFFLREAELQNYTDPQDRTNDKVKEYLVPGDTVTVEKIQKEGSKRYGHAYMAVLKYHKLPEPKFRCNIIAAISTGELVLTMKQ